MKKNSLLLFIVFLCNISFAQQNFKKRSNEEKARFYTQEMKDSLALTEVQEPLVFEINLQVSKSIDSLYKNINEPAERKKKFREIFKTRDEALKNVLELKQFLRYEDIEMEKWEKKKREAKKDKE
ncbi:MAG: hypothetical protein KA275_02295 [Chitinophagaceae bacterium]|nr:hypothetical protein [Chitinophagaceae bacterium]